MRKNYDLIVIGSGIGGLTAALTASREGKNVLMLEGAKNFGGYINPFKRQNYHFDPGVHYLGELGEGQRFRKLLDHLGLENVRFNELNPEGFDWYIFPDYQIKFGASLDNYEKQLITDFPHEKKGIHQFFKIIHRLEDANSAFLQMKGLKGLVKALPYVPHFLKRGKATLEEILDTHFMDQKLKAVIAAPCGDIGLPPSQIHGLVHLGVISHYSRGAYFPYKKTDLRNEIVKKLEIQGVVLKNRSTVTRIMNRKGVVTGVELENGDQFFSQTVISNAQAGETFKMIDPSRLSQKESLSLENLEHSISSICVFLGVNNGIDTSIIQDRNIWFYSTYDINGLYKKAQKGETTGDEFIFLNIPTMKDKKGERAPVGDHIVEIVTFVNSKKFKSFFDQKVMKRDKEYQKLKDKIADNMIHTAEKFIPGLMDNIVIREVSTPATNYTYINSPEGNIYGPAQTVEQSGPNRFSITGPLEGLFLSGASVISAGVFPCAASGFWAGKKALKRIKSLENKNVPNRDKPLNNDSHRLTAIQKIRYWSSIKPLEAALKFRNNNSKWLETSWKEYEAKVFQVAKGLIKLGIKKGESVAIISENRPEWLYTQMGTIASGGIFTPIYPTCGREEIVHIMNHSKSQYIFIDHQTQYEKVTTAFSEMGCLKKIIHFDIIDKPHLQRSTSFEDLITLGEPVLDYEVEQIVADLNPDSTVQYLYTSGTTAPPKGVPITHRSLDTMGVATIERFPVEEGVRLFSCLPLNNVMEQTVSTLIHLEKGGVLSFCPKTINLKKFLPEVRPYLLLATPLIWKRLEILLKKEFETQTPPMRRVISWARRVEYSSFLKELKSNRPFTSYFRKLANKFVLNKIREELGMDRVIFALNATEPVSIKTQRFFISLGIIITNLYGMCESAGIVSTTDPARPRPGVVGTPLRGSELKISWEGELLAKGPTLARKYLNDTKNTHQLWHEGWMQTGDLVVEPKPGAIRIRGRKKEILMTAEEVGVNPCRIESYLTAITCIAQAVVIGNKQPYLVCLLTLEEENTILLAGSLGISSTNIESISETPEFLGYLEQRIKDDVNNRLTRAESIRNFMIIPHPFSIETGELTATQKIKRRVVNKKYRAEIMALYR